jgi:N-acetylglutamate synthase-like GNAT family acetyltransferase
MRVREAMPADRDWLQRFLESHHSLVVARRGELAHPLDHPMLVAESDDGAAAGVLTYVPGGGECEILTLHAVRPWAGAGSALVAALCERAAGARWRRLWLVTTNDNVDALRFYQRRGFRLAALRAGAVDEARRHLKPEISELGAYGIPLRDELELELRLESG